jgi:poly(A) polymerase
MSDSRTDRITASLVADHLAGRVLQASALKEVERLMLVLLKGTPFAGKAYATGGYVRDEVLGIPSKDLDIVVEMRDGAERLTNFLHDTIPEKTTKPLRLGASYPIWEIKFTDDIEFHGQVYRTGGAVVQFADTQKEMFPDKGSRQRVTEFGTLQEDVERRDFTVNVLMKDLSTGELKDLTGLSLNDIQKGILRGNPNVDFDKVLADDPLRMMRLVRFQAKYGWNVPLWVMKAVKRNAKRIEIISAERVRDELVKVMELGKLKQAVRLMKAVGLLQYVLPEIQALIGVEHEYSRGRHQEGDVYKHTLLVLQNAKPGVENQLAALLHDVGKPESQEVINGLIKFIGHEKVGAEMAEAIMRRLKFTNEVVGKVSKIVESHMRPHLLVRDDATGSKSLRKFIRDVGVELVDAVLDLAEADQLGMLPPSNMIPDLRKQIDLVMAPVKQAEVLPLDGNDIQRILNIGPGAMVGMALRYLKDVKYEWELAGKQMTKADAEAVVLEKFRSMP